MWLTAARLKDHWREQRLFLVRSTLSAFLMLLLTLIVVARLVDLQVFQHEHFSDLSTGNRVRIEPLPPTRGLVYDRNGNLLAENLPSYQLELVPEGVADVEGTLARLVELDLVAEDELDRIRQSIRRQPRFRATALRFRLTDEEVARFAVVRQHFPGVDVQARLIRNYPYGSAAVHALGYVGAVSQADLDRGDPADYAGTTHTGKIGVERAEEDALHGTVGYRQVLVNAQGRILQEVERTRPVPGHDVSLTLDLELQLTAESALGDRRGAVVAIDPANGHVLALVSKPAYDPNLFAAGISPTEYRALRDDRDTPLFNRALRGVYPPGSTVKPMIGLAGLHYGSITPWRRVYCIGHYSLPGSSHRYRDWRKEGHGSVTLTDAVAQSCDVYFYDLAVKLGIDNLQEFLGRFGLGELTGIDIPSEKPGTLPSREWKRTRFSRREDQVWYPGETVITGIGQGYMETTPLQMAHMTATVAARGIRYRPMLVASRTDPATGDSVAVEPHALTPVEVSNPSYWDRVVDDMTAVVHGERGTARRIGLDAPYRIAGKTGTAQVFTVAQDQEYDAETVDERLRHHALFVAFAPADAPRIAVAVVVENGGSGSAAAAPVARLVLDNYLLRGDG